MSTSTPRLRSVLLYALGVISLLEGSPSSVIGVIGVAATPGGFLSSWIPRIPGCPSRLSPLLSSGRPAFDGPLIKIGRGARQLDGVTADGVYVPLLREEDFRIAADKIVELCR